MTPPAEPIFFGPEDRPLAGWLHRPASQTSSLGVLVCNPFGYESVCAHRSLRHIAETVARAGIPVMRFDYDGTGDSAGDDRDSGRLSAWIRSVHCAIDTLKQSTALDRVALLGLRLGATVAALAAAERDDVVALVAFAPVISGKAYLRELKLLQAALGLNNSPVGVTVEPGILEAIGFAIIEETRTAITEVDLLSQPRRPAPAVMVLDREDLPTADRWIEHLKTRGAEVDSRRVTGYVEMVLDPHKAIVPTASIELAALWLSERSAVVASAPSSSVTRVSGSRFETRLSAEMTPEAQERAVFVDGDRLLFGVWSTPSKAPFSGRAIILLNAGAVHHVGPNRLYTVMARRWAALGHAVLRLDSAGVGDSRPHPDEAENVVYSAGGVEDVGAAVAWVRDQPGVVACHVLGLCSGAYHAFKAVVAGHPIDGAVLINPLTFFWKEGQSLDYPAFRVVGEVARYQRSVRDPAKWKKLLRGDVDLGTLAQALGRHGAAVLVHGTRDALRRAGMPLSDDLGAELEASVERKVQLRFVFATGDPGLELLEREGGSVLSGLLDRGLLTIDLIEGADHTFTPLWSHAALIAMLDHVVASS